MGWIKLKEVGMKESHIRKLMGLYKDYEELYIEENFKLFNDKLKIQLEKAEKIRIDDILEKYGRHRIRIINANAGEYPKILKELVDYPLFLYVKGKELCENSSFNKNQNERKNIAVVGTRKMTKFGKSSCEKIVRELIEYKITLISGLAEGIDTTALTTSVEKSGKTVAVVGTGLDIVYPYENKYLWEKICNIGTVISEYPLGTQPSKWTFPRRNRIIAGLSDGILIGESFKSGGSLITAELGFSMNKEIFAIPGFINYPSFEGCNNLIKENRAKLVTCAEDIAKEFLWDINSEKTKTGKLDGNEKLIFDNIIEETSIEELIKKLNIDCKKNFSVNEVLSILMSLKIKGLIMETGTAGYMRII